MESLRATGYSVSAAVADLVDNSIAAGARSVWIEFRWNGSNSSATFLDDGCGMSEPELVNAMRLGSRHPQDVRNSSDLGRYGLGLKTASISQARSLTVATLRESTKEIYARQWDLDHLAVTRRWELLRLSPLDLGSRAERLLAQAHGTLVVWNKLDRVVGDAEVDDEFARNQFLGLVRRVEDDLSMVFHRFMSPPNPVHVWVNGHKVSPWDPFLSREPATQQLATEQLSESGQTVIITPFVLPHHSRLTPDQHREGGGPAGWNAQQGFYVYRQRRLIVPGDWLGLGFAKEEHYKLARIRLDLPNSVDEQWQLDVRKSRAQPPQRNLHDLRRIAKAARNRAVSVYRRRGQSTSRSSGDPVHVWIRRVKHDKVTYQVNRRHPIIRNTLSGDIIEKGAYKQVIRLIEEYIPIQQIWIDLADGDETNSRPFEESSNSEIKQLIASLYGALKESGMTHQLILERMVRVEAIGDRHELVEETLSGLLKAHAE